jgi:hypothetical protein
MLATLGQQCLDPPIHESEYLAICEESHPSLDGEKGGARIYILLAMGFKSLQIVRIR